MYVSLTELGIRQNIEFLIDTGAARTVIMEKDAEKLAIDFNSLSKSTIGLIGIGGAIETYDAKNASLHFAIKPGEDYAIKMDSIRIARVPKRAATTPSMPSMIGRDILNRYKLEYDKRHDSVFIADE
ncbi:MAG: retroviral-like aspartic protease family protein [Candidatus Micrarchaeaceae archaeon]